MQSTYKNYDRYSNRYRQYSYVVTKDERKAYMKYIEQRFKQRKV